jgi:hypothetical protein
VEKVQHQSIEVTESEHKGGYKRQCWNLRNIFIDGAAFSERLKDADLIIHCSKKVEQHSSRRNGEIEFMEY